MTGIQSTTLREYSPRIRANETNLLTVEVSRMLAQSLDVHHEHGNVVGVFSPESITLRFVDDRIAQLMLAVDSARPAWCVAPECLDLKRKPDTRSDMYGLGALLYWIFTGKELPSSEVERQSDLSRTALNPLIRAGILKATARLPEERFASANEIVEIMELAFGLTSDGSADGTPSAGPAGSIVILSGADAGKRIALQSERIFVGSNPGCQIVVPNISPRTLLIEVRGEKVTLVVLSTTSIAINGKELSAKRDTDLNFGDTISVGDVSFRRVQGSEVLSFKSGVKRSRVAEVEGRLQRMVRWGLVGVALTVVGGFVLYRSDVSNEGARASKQAQQEATKREAQVGVLIELGDGLFRRGNLREPQCSGADCQDIQKCASAEECYSKVLSIAPADTYASGRLQEIARRTALAGRTKTDNNERIAALLKSGDDYFNRGALVYPPGANARAIYAELLALDPGNSIAVARLAEIGKKLGVTTTDVPTLLRQARKFLAAGQIVAPEGQNAFSTLLQVLSIDGQNKAAADALLDLSAFAFHRADRAHKQADAQGLAHWLDVAQTLGVGDDLLNPLRSDLKLIQSSHASVVVVDAPVKPTPLVKSSSQNGGVDSGEIQRRAAKLELDSEISGDYPKDVLLDWEAEG